jgi:hypothetical protein
MGAQIFSVENVEASGPMNVMITIFGDFDHFL